MAPPPMHDSAVYCLASMAAWLSSKAFPPVLTPPVCPQDDMHRVIDRQLMDSHLKEQSRPPAALSRAPGLGRGDEPSTAEGKRLFSFFRKI